MKLFALAALSLAAGCTPQKAPSNSDLKRAERIGLERRADQANLSASESAERARLVATAQLRAKLGDRSATEIQTVGSDRATDARKFQDQLQILRKGSGAEGK